MRTLLYEKILSDCFFSVIIIILLYIVIVSLKVYMIRLLHKTLWNCAVELSRYLIVLLI